MRMRRFWCWINLRGYRPTVFPAGTPVRWQIFLLHNGQVSALLAKSDGSPAWVIALTEKLQVCFWSPRPRMPSRICNFSFAAGKSRSDIGHWFGESPKLKDRLPIRLLMFQAISDEWK